MGKHDELYESSEYNEEVWELAQRTDWKIEYYPDRNDGWYVKYINQKQDEETNIRNNG